ncbi:MAG: carboxypeptidase-like regulatory domain-containing protein [Blastocatellia bacterium]|nr:carboxypeptidase-like regulatory domain-containing protein [Blastocatellia bacterium]
MIGGLGSSCMYRSRLVIGIILLSGWLLSGWLPQTAQAAPYRGGRVEGIVVCAETGAPLSGVQVWLDRVAEPALSPRRKAVTNEAGMFVFKRVHPGHYRLYAHKSDYLLGDYLQQQQAEPGSALEIAEGSSVSHLMIRLSKGGQVSGLVLDEHGQPAADLIVKLLALTTAGDQVATVGVFTAKTDAAGRYRLHTIPPGRYVLRAERRRLAGSDAQLEFAYYPDGDSWGSAMPLEIKPGDALSDIQLMFTPHADQTVVSGTVTDALTGQPLANVRVDLVDGANLGLEVITDENGAFRLTGMSPGPCTISAHGGTAGDGYEWKLKRLVVQPGENTVHFRLNPATQVSGTVQYIGHAQAPVPGDFMVSVRVGTHARGITYTGQDTFHFTDLKAGQTQIQVGFAALQYKLAAILVDGQDVTGQTLTLQPGEKLTNVQILITDEPLAERPINP